jgi:hypothetical protein
VPLAAILAELAAKGLVQRDPATGAVHVAYPFSAMATAHHVTLALAGGDGASDRDGRTVFAMCALDALGIPPMLRQEAIIVSRDALTNEPVEVSVTAVDGASPATLAGWSARWQPPSAVVYARLAEHEHEHEHDGGCEAAGTCCPITNFFTDTDHAQQWAETHGVPDGVVLAPVEALHRAQALFGGVLHRVEAVQEEQEP